MESPSRTSSYLNPEVDQGQNLTEIHGSGILGAAGMGSDTDAA